MTSCRSRLACPPWFTRLALVPGLLLVAAGGCSPRALIAVDVVSDTPFQNVTLRLSDGTTSKDFARVSFTAAMPYKAGLYVDGGGSSALITARALDGGNCIGIGQGAVTGVSGGNATAPIIITVMHSSSCVGTPAGTGGSTGGGVGGDNGGGTGGSGTGTGGSTGGGVGGSNLGVGGSNAGVGGANGTGGQTGGNLITNGDFSSGEDSWGFPAMLGSVTHAVTNGALCVTLGATSSVTIGYPTGATAPFQIIGGASYRFSYQASVSANNTTFEAKVGQTQPLYDATGSDWPGEAVGTFSSDASTSSGVR